MSEPTIVTENFSAAHLYHQKKWSEAENKACFGKCFTEYGHGHNYTLEVGFSAPQSLRQPLQAHVKAVTDLLDHQHLNFVIPEFKDTIPTTENIAIYLLKKLQERCPNEGLSYIKLFETTDLWVEIRV
jgi:6-pyruvoyltetrahydropterin/6-carboxytetrahydropterin synthase